MNLNDIELYKINEVMENTYYQIPQELFVNPLYKDIGLEAKMVYAFVLDRLTLSKKNNWVDQNGNVYLIFTRNEAAEKLCLSQKTTIKAFKQLTSVDKRKKLT